ncbi:MAG: hypothetical protein AB8B36_00480 [Prochlorococcus sp.]
MEATTVWFQALMQAAFFLRTVFDHVFDLNYLLDSHSLADVQRQCYKPSISSSQRFSPKGRWQKGLPRKIPPVFTHRDSGLKQNLL